MFTTTYDRSSKTWRTVTPAGVVIEHAHRAELEMQYLAAVAPALAARVATCAQRFPQLGDRARRAGLLVAGQDVHPCTSADPHATLNQFAWVRGSGYQEDDNGRVLTRDRYAVTHSDRGYGCDCPDDDAPFVPALKGNICKHVLAAILAGL